MNCEVEIIKKIQNFSVMPLAGGHGGFKPNKILVVQLTLFQPREGSDYWESNLCLESRIVG